MTQQQRAELGAISLDYCQENGFDNSIANMRYRAVAENEIVTVKNGDAILTTEVVSVLLNGVEIEVPANDVIKRLPVDPSTLTVQFLTATTIKYEGNTGFPGTIGDAPEVPEVPEP